MDVSKLSDCWSRICSLCHLSGPGHFLEVERILPLLAHSSPEHPSFHVVAFSLPGFGFSETPKGKGFAISQYAEVRMISLLGQIRVEVFTNDDIHIDRSQTDAGPRV